MCCYWICIQVLKNGAVPAYVRSNVPEPKLIISDPDPQIENQCCGSGSGLDPDSIRSVDPDPDPDSNPDPDPDPGA